MVSYFLVAGATLLELLCTIFVINGLVGETVVKWKLYFSVSFCLFSV